MQQWNKEKEGLILYLNLSGVFKKDISGIFLIKKKKTKHTFAFKWHAYK